MGEFGSQLRMERESRGIGLDSISNSTKISNRYLVALEEENFERLPGGVFNKGIVRSYARIVGLDEEEWVNRYMAAYQQSGKLKFDDADWIAFAENVSKTREIEEDIRPARKLRWAGVAVLLLILVGLGWFVWRYVHGRISEEGALHVTGVSHTCVSSPRFKNTLA
ncbi:helix-turn-helix domain-containing protein [Silvibacterium acidisoli]|uniref:helix-turn-helix domain-containing protein n=1 Tax=Acidobacteriaceae bacterium ZG23-2 TaxID=2883246 RepID=UPI00406C26D0